MIRWIRFWTVVTAALVVAALTLAAMGTSAHAATTSKTVYLTFDDGPGIYTQGTLDLLSKYGAKATFFAIGEHMVQYPDLVAEENSAGHEIGNHTWDHPHLADLGQAEVKAELTQTQSLMKSMGVASNCFRPPFFSTNPSVEQWAKELGLRQVMYKADMTSTREVTIGKASEPDPMKIYRNVTSTVFDGAIVTLHTENGSNLGQYQALALILPKLKSMGYVMKALPYCNRTVTRIMPLGDSITVGVGQDGAVRSAYRLKLDDYLRHGAVPSGFTYRWVGEHVSEPRVGLNHEGNGGWTIEQIYDNITAWQATYEPDVILLHIGTNNITRGDSAATTEGKLAKLLARIRHNQPSVRVFVAKIIDVSSGTPAAEQLRNAVYSSGVSTVVSNAGTRFYTVDMRGIGGEALYDYHHPNRFGYTKMAYLWYEAMRGILPYSNQWVSNGSPYHWTHYVICHYNYTLKKKVCADQPVNDGKG